MLNPHLPARCVPHCLSRCRPHRHFAAALAAALASALYRSRVHSSRAYASASHATALIAPLPLQCHRHRCGATATAAVPPPPPLTHGFARPVLPHPRLAHTPSAPRLAPSPRPSPPRLATAHSLHQVITRAPATRQLAQGSRIAEYLYGVHRELFPHAVILDFAQVQVYSIGVAPQAPSSALPIGMRMAENQMASKQLPAALYPSLCYSLLAVLHAESGKCDDLLAANAAGFVWVSAVDIEKMKITLLTPSPLAMPSLVLLQGSIKWSQDQAR